MGGETETTYHIEYKDIYECDGRMVKNRYTGAEICDSTITLKETTRTKTTNIKSILLEDGTKEIRCNSKGSRIIGFYDKEKNENTSVSTILKSLGMCEGNEYLKTKKGFEYVWEINQGALKIQDKCKKFYTKMQNEKGNYLKNEEEWRSCINQDYRTLTSEVKKPLTYQEFFDAYYNNVDIAD